MLLLSRMTKMAVKPTKVMASVASSVGQFLAPPLVGAKKMRCRDDEGKLRRSPQPEEIPRGLPTTIARPVWRSSSARHYPAAGGRR